MLSQAGKSVIVKSNLTGISMFLMQGIKIPKYIAKEIDCKKSEISSRIIIWSITLTVLFP